MSTIAVQAATARHPRKVLMTMLAAKRDFFDDVYLHKMQWHKDSKMLLL